MMHLHQDAMHMYQGTPADGPADGPLLGQRLDGCRLR